MVGELGFSLGICAGWLIVCGVINLGSRRGVVGGLGNPYLVVAALLLGWLIGDRFGLPREGLVYGPMMLVLLTVLLYVRRLVFGVV